MPDVADQAAPAKVAEPEPIPSMSFLDHLEELRRRLIYSLLAVGGGFAVAWTFADRIFTVMQQPIMAALQRHGLDERLVYLSPIEPFNMYLKIGLLGGLFLASPIVLYQVWMFISPGLYRHEKRYVVPFMLATVGLFLAGGYFGFRIAYPLALEFLIGYGEQFQPMITIGAYANLFLTVIIGLGIVFEMPIFIFFLALMRVVSARFLWRNFRYAVLGIFVVSAFLTPPDVMSMMIFAGPMLALYLFSIGIAWMVYPGKKKAA
jgi:sec-independent protein translocase protein TatC